MGYRDVVLADTPAHYWELPPLGAQIFQDLGALANTMIARAGTMNGGYNGVWDGGLAAAYNGATRQGADTAEVLVAPYSAEAWCWLYSFNGADNILLNWAGGGANGLGLHLNAARQARFAVDNLDIHAAVALSLHAWHHLVGVYSGGTATLYVDGVSVASIGGGGALGASDVVTIGESSTGANPYNGLLASPATYAYGLISAQISAHLAAASNRNTFPTFLGGGSASVVGPGGTPSGTESGVIAAIYNSVRKVY